MKKYNIEKIRIEISFRKDNKKFATEKLVKILGNKNYENLAEEDIKKIVLDSLIKDINEKYGLDLELLGVELKIKYEIIYTLKAKFNEYGD